MSQQDIARHLILFQGRREEPVPHIRSVLLESKGLHVMLHLMVLSLVKGPKGGSVQSPTARIKRGKVTTKETCSFEFHWICLNVSPLIQGTWLSGSAILNLLITLGWCLYFHCPGDETSNLGASEKYLKLDKINLGHIALNLQFVFW